jgi:hypothetical protein
MWIDMMTPSKQSLGQNAGVLSQLPFRALSFQAAAGVWSLYFFDTRFVWIKKLERLRWIRRFKEGIDLDEGNRRCGW